MKARKTPPSLNAPYVIDEDGPLPDPGTRTPNGEYLRNRMLRPNAGLNRFQRRRIAAIERGKRR